MTNQTERYYYDNDKHEVVNSQQLLEEFNQLLDNGDIPQQSFDEYEANCLVKNGGTLIDMLNWKYTDLLTGRMMS